MTKNTPENTAFTTNEKKQETKPLTLKTVHKEMIPLHCSVCGKMIAYYYPETIPGIIFATCRDGHKIKIRKDNFLREAV